MKLRVVGAGLPRTGTSSLRTALEQLLGGPCCHMSALPGHPFNLGTSWQQALAGEPADWGALLESYVAAVDWPAAFFWRELSAANPDAVILLSQRDRSETWLQSMEATVLPVARMALAPDWNDGQDLLTLLERFTGTKQWDDPTTLMVAYERHNVEVRSAIPAHRLVEWQASQGWGPICRGLGISEPDQPFPWNNRREEWG